VSPVTVGASRAALLTPHSAPHGTQHPKHTGKIRLRYTAVYYLLSCLPYSKKLDYFSLSTILRVECAPKLTNTTHTRTHTPPGEKKLDDISKRGIRDDTVHGHSPHTGGADECVLSVEHERKVR
jgi:hypothetical protein